MAIGRHSMRSAPHLRNTNPPAIKEDSRKVVYKQVEEKGPMSRETKKKVDQGIDTIFEKVELTTAKDFEKLGEGSGQQATPTESVPSL